MNRKTVRAHVPASIERAYIAHFCIPFHAPEGVDPDDAADAIAREVARMFPGAWHDETTEPQEPTR